MKLDTLLENYTSLKDNLMSIGQSRLPTRLRVFVDTNFKSYAEFMRAVDQFEYDSPQEARRILQSGKLQLLINHLSSNDLESISTRRATSLNTGTEIDPYASQRRGTVVTDTGDVPVYLFRYVTPEEVDQIKQDGFVIPSELYHRVHASLYPERRYKVPNGTLLAIRFDMRDQWKVKEASDTVYVTSDRKIPTTRVFICT